MGSEMCIRDRAYFSTIHPGSPPAAAVDFSLLTFKLPCMATRTFISLKLPPELIAETGKLQSRLESRLATREVRWTKPEQLHLTLCFLGDVATERLGQLEAALRAACASARPLNLRLERIGCFPNTSRPNVLWLGVSGDVDALLALATRISNATKEYGAHQEARAFQAHLTIGRLRQAPPQELARIGASIETARVEPLGEWTAASVELMSSELLPSGAKYTQLASIGLPGAPIS